MQNVFGGAAFFVSPVLGVADSALSAFFVSSELLLSALVVSEPPVALLLVEAGLACVRGAELCEPTDATSVLMVWLVCATGD